MNLIEQTKKDNVKYIQLQFTDLHGMIKAVNIPVERLKEALEKGIWFDGSSIEGFTRIFESDMVLHPDASTYAVLPWEEDPTARLICDVHMPDGEPFEGDPRHILKRALAEASKMGFEYNIGPELEFFLFKKTNGDFEPATHDVAGYFDYSPRDLATSVRNEIVRALESMGMEVEMSHHEVAFGQHEIDFKYGNALLSADRCLTFKHVVKSIAHKHDLYATFMPKPVYGINGSGMHINQSLFTDGKNAFYDAEDEYKLSKTARHFIAGQLKQVRGMSAVLSPTVNSYKRLVPGYEAPVYICWARRNRSALVRIPRYSPGREQSTRAELRCPDPSCNPYLALAVMLTAGLDGIKSKLEPPTPVEENVYHLDESGRESKGIGTLPGSLKEALDEFKKNSLLRTALGEHTFSKYLEAKKEEWDDYALQVTPWEKKRYFEVI
ncbi:MAG: type I glutamate--ammonia ligase [Nanoarchaeota archaeon]|nr:type I glutamate--ammonia ligase [Nanoarchaeota archaeon]